MLLEKAVDGLDPWQTNTPLRDRPVVETLPPPQAGAGGHKPDPATSSSNVLTFRPSF